MVTYTSSEVDNFDIITGSDGQDRLSVCLIADPTGEEVLITVTPPLEPKGDGEIKKRRAPVDFVLTIDVSGSMAEEANIPGDTGKLFGLASDDNSPADLSSLHAEKSGLSILDIVKHAAKTIIASMGDKDRIGIVAFHTEARVSRRAPRRLGENADRIILG